MIPPSKCKICAADFESDATLHRHLRSHKILTENYYKTHYARCDLLTGEPLPFKHKYQYFTTDFLNRENLRIWFDKQTHGKKLNYCENLLIRRRQLKEIKYTPSQVELRSLISPSIPTYNKLFGNYWDLCEKIGFINK